MADNNWPIYMIAGGAAVGSIYAIGWAASKIEIAYGQAYSVVVSPHTLAVPIAAWVVPTATAGAAALGASTVVFVLVKAGEKAAREPAEWTVPLLALLGGFLLDLAKGFGFENNEFLKAVFALVVAFLVVVASALWKTSDLKLKALSIILLVAPPFAVLTQSLRANGAGKLMEDIRKTDISVWFRLGGFVVIGVASAALYALYGSGRPVKPSSSRSATRA
jgi:hypothetical protein